MPKFGDFFGPNFIAFGLNTEIYRVNLHMQFKYGKMQARKNSTLFTEWNKISVFSTNTGRYILGKILIWTLFEKWNKLPVIFQICVNILSKTAITWDFSYNETWFSSAILDCDSQRTYLAEILLKKTTFNDN